MGRNRIPTPFDSAGGATVLGTVEISNDVGNPIPVSGTITAGAQFAEDIAATSGDLGTLALVVRKDAEGSNVSADGDYATLLVDANGRLKVVLASSKAEDSASVDGDTGVFVLAVRHDADGTLVGTDGDYAALQLDANGRLKVNPGTVTVTGTAANTEFAEDSVAVDGALGKLVLVVRKDAEGSNVSTDGDYATLQVDALGRLRVATGAGYAEDSAATDGDRGLFVLAMRHDANTATVGTDGDYSALQTDAIGLLKVNGSGVTQPVSGTVTANAGTGTLAVSAASLPLPAGAATAAKQPALGTAGSPAADVISVQGLTNGTPAAVGGQMVMVAAGELTRPADTTAYAALDAVSDSTSTPTLLTFTNLARVAAGSGYIVKARLMTDQKTCTARFRLHLYHTAPSAINDNSPFLLLYANNAKRVSHVDFPALFTEDPTNSTAAAAAVTDARLAFVCDSSDRNLYGALEVRDAFTPASGQKFYVELTADLN